MRDKLYKDVVFFREVKGHPRKFEVIRKGSKESLGMVWFDKERREYMGSILGNHAEYVQVFQFLDKKNKQYLRGQEQAK